MKIIIIVLLIIILLLFHPRVLHCWTVNYPYLKVRTRILYNYEEPGERKMINPSLVKVDDEIICAIRYTNAVMKNLGMYIKFRSNYMSCIGFIIFSRDFKTQKSIFPTFPNSDILEDPRIMYDGNVIYVSATEYKKNGKDVYPVLFELSKTLDVKRRIDYLNYYSPSRIQKNWCPFNHKGVLALHTDTYPDWRVYEINKKTGVLISLCNVNVKDFFEPYIIPNSFLRCSTSWVEFTTKTYLCGLHIKHFNSMKLPVFRTMLVEVSKDTLLPIRSTHFFLLHDDNHPIQFLSGLEIVNDKIVLAFGIGDFSYTLRSLSRLRIEKMLSLSKHS